jgi:hypothetical protein
VTPSSATRDVRLPSGVIVVNVPSNCSVAVKNDLSRFTRDQAIVDALKKATAMKKNQPTNHTRHSLGAFAALHPQMATMHQEQIGALAQSSLLLEPKAVCESDCSSLATDFCWLTLSNVANSSPSAQALTNWVVELAGDQHVIFSEKMMGAKLFC